MLPKVLFPSFVIRHITLVMSRHVLPETFHPHIYTHALTLHIDTHKLPLPLATSSIQSTRRAAQHQQQTSLPFRRHPSKVRHNPNNLSNHDSSLPANANVSCSIYLSCQDHTTFDRPSCWKHDPPSTTAAWPKAPSTTARGGGRPLPLLVQRKPCFKACGPSTARRRDRSHPSPPFFQRQLCFPAW